jgi:hypothetical protein
MATTGIDSWDAWPDPIPPVDPQDLHIVWALMTETPEGVGICVSLFQSICSPGANVFAVWYRVSILKMCERLQLLTHWLSEGHLDDAVFKVAADYKMHKMSPGIPQEGLPLDVDGFLNRVEAESKKA